MKRLLTVIFVVVGLNSIARSAPPATFSHSANETYDMEGGIGFFYSSLSPYGEWINSSYGTAWRPYHVEHYWRPYLDGRWVWTSYGWYWVSNEPFGWATFHYGRWYYDDYYGWIWTPDDVWGPAWVEWRYDDDYIGWAPLPPVATFSVNVGITFRDSWVAPIHYWNFVPCRNFTSTRIVDYVQPIERSRRIFGGTHREINIVSDHDRIINRGVDVGFVERRGNVRVNQADVVQNNQGSGERVVRENNRDRIEVFRPRLDTRPNGNQSRQPEVQRPDRRPANRDDAQDRANRDLINRGVYDRQRAKLPNGSENREPARQARQNRELDQKFEIPKRGDQVREHPGRMSPKEGWGQQRREEFRRPQQEERHEWKKPERQQDQPRDQEKKESRSRGRRP